MKPLRVAVDDQHNLYIVDRDAFPPLLRRVDGLTGTIDTIANTGASGYAGETPSGTSTSPTHSTTACAR